MHYVKSFDRNQMMITTGDSMVDPNSTARLIGEIVVTDNGCGFAPADGNEPHIALKNIRQRLDLMCGGRLTIKSGNDGGTVVTIMIPAN